jgi:hypothetical protein
VLVLFDNNVPRGLARALTGHTVHKARQHGWDTLQNGELLRVAEENGFHVMVTSDKNIRYQHNFEGRKLALVVLMQRTLACRSKKTHRNCQGRECCNTWQLYGSGNPL